MNGVIGDGKKRPMLLIETSVFQNGARKPHEDKWKARFRVCKVRYLRRDKGVDTL